MDDFETAMDKIENRLERRIPKRTGAKSDTGDRGCAAAFLGAMIGGGLPLIILPLRGYGLGASLAVSLGGSMMGIVVGVAFVAVENLNARGWKSK